MLSRDNHEKSTKGFNYRHKFKIQLILDQGYETRNSDPRLVYASLLLVPSTNLGNCHALSLSLNLHCKTDRDFVEMPFQNCSYLNGFDY